MRRLFPILLLLAILPRLAAAQDLPTYLRDRGTGIRTSLLGSYVRAGEFTFYPFFEWYGDNNLEYKPSELGYGAGDEDYRGQFEASEGILFLAYGLGRNLAIEFEAAVIGAELEKSTADPSAMPFELTESGLGDVEGQIRWRWMEESARRPEAFAYFETVFPLQRNRRIIGTQAWEYVVGGGVTKGFRWGTVTFRASAEYARDAGKVDWGEYAFEYLKQISPRWRVVTAIEGNQLDEISLLAEVQWRFHPRAVLKANSGLGLTPNATGFAPEIGVMFTF